MLHVVDAEHCSSVGRGARLRSWVGDVDVGAPVAVHPSGESGRYDRREPEDGQFAAVSKRHQITAIVPVLFGQGFAHVRGDTFRRRKIMHIPSRGVNRNQCSRM